MNFMSLSRIFTLIVIIIFSASLTGNSIAQDTVKSEKKTIKSDQSGVITYLDGKAEKKKQRAPDWLTAHVQTKVGMGEKIKTLEKSRAELEIDWDTIIRLSENTVVDFIKLFKDINNKFEAAELKVDEGEVWASMEKLDDNSTFSIGDSLAKAEIRGTTFSYRHTAEGSTIKVYKGAIEVKSASTVSGPKAVDAPHEVQGPHEVSPPHAISLDEWTFTVGAMQEITIPADTEKKPHVRTFDADDNEEQSDWIQWNKERDKLRLQKRKGENREKTSNE